MTKVMKIFVAMLIFLLPVSSVSASVAISPVALSEHPQSVVFDDIMVKVPGSWQVERTSSQINFYSPELQLTMKNHPNIQLADDQVRERLIRVSQRSDLTIDNEKVYELTEGQAYQYRLLLDNEQGQYEGQVLLFDLTGQTYELTSYQVDELSEAEQVMSDLYQSLQSYQPSEQWQDFDFYSASFQVPKDWTFEQVGRDLYFYLPDGIMFLKLHSDLDIEKIVSADQDAGITLTELEPVKLKEQTGKVFEFVQEVNQQTYSGNVLFFQIEDQLVSLVLGKNQDSQLDHQDVWEQIVTSLSE